MAFDGRPSGTASGRRVAQALLVAARSDPTSSTRRWPRTFAWAHPTRPTRTCTGCSTAVGLADLLANLPAGPRHGGRPRRPHAERGRAPARRPGPRPAPPGARAAARRAHRRARPADRGAPGTGDRALAGRAHRRGGGARAAPPPPLRRRRDPAGAGGPPVGGLAVSRAGGPLRRVLAEPGTPYGRLALAGLLGLAAAAATIGLLAGSGYVVGRAALQPGTVRARRHPGRGRGARLPAWPAALRRTPRRPRRGLARADPLAAVALRLPLAPGARRAGRVAQRRPARPRHRRRRRAAGPLPAHAACRSRSPLGAAVIGTVAVGVILPWAALALGLPLLVALDRARAAHLAPRRRRRDGRARRHAFGPGRRRAGRRARAARLRRRGAPAGRRRGTRRRGATRCERRHARLGTATTLLMQVCLGRRGDGGAGDRCGRRARAPHRPGHGGRAAAGRAGHVRDGPRRPAGGGALARGARRGRAPLRARGRAGPCARPARPVGAG